jgi:hypothetical protein
MLATNSSPPEYVKHCRASVDDLLKAYRKLAAATKGSPAVANFAPQFFNHLVLALDEYFVHRLRAVEGKDGNPLNEVRVRASSVMLHDGILNVEKSIKLEPETSVLGLAPAIASNSTSEHSPSWRPLTSTRSKPSSPRGAARRTARAPGRAASPRARGDRRS